jgi:hypothetical protein
MKDFDAEREEAHAALEEFFGDRKFKIGGRVFKHRAAVPYTTVRELIEMETTGASVYTRLERAAVLMTEGDPDELLNALRGGGDVPVTTNDLNDFVNWLVEAQSQRPTEAPSSSTDGGATTSTASTENSSSPPAEASKDSPSESS